MPDELTMGASPESVETEVNQQTLVMGDEYSPEPNLALQGEQQVGESEVSAEPQGQAVSTDAVVAGDEFQKPTAIDPLEYTKLQEQTTALQAQIENLTRMASFYQQMYNEAQVQPAIMPTPGISGGQGQQPFTTVQPGADGGNKVEPQLPQGVKLPDEWETPADAANYSRHIAQETVKQTVGQVAQVVTAQMQSINKWVSQIEEMVIKTAHPDFDEVTNSVLPELFATDHEGKIWTGPDGAPRVINAALLQYIRQSPSPRQALYQYGLSKRAPQTIAKAKQETTKNLLKSLDTKPKGPTMPKQSSGAPATMTLDWNTPREIADKLL